VFANGLSTAAIVTANAVILSPTTRHSWLGLIAWWRRDRMESTDRIRWDSGQRGSGGWSVHTENSNRTYLGWKHAAENGSRASVWGEIRRCVGQSSQGKLTLGQNQALGLNKQIQ
jgi:hypothetical protein